MRLKALVLSLAACLLMTLAAHAASVTMPTPLVSVDASNLPLGDLLVWYNAGSLGGSFQEVGAPPQVQMVNGIKAVTFTGWNGFRSTFPNPSVLTGTNPYSMSARFIDDNANKAAEQWFLALTRNGGTNLQTLAFGYGNNLSYGAVHHWGNNDMGWDRGMPTQGVWHSMIVTYSGVSSWERIYIDGILTSIENKFSTNDIQDIGYPFLIGVVDDNDSYGKNFQGSLASLKVWAQELTFDQVNAEYYNTTVPNPAPVVPQVINAGFELPRAWSQNTAPADNRSIPGWCCSDTFAAAGLGASSRGGIGVCGPNLNLLATGSHWDNGANPEGVSVMSIAGAASAGQGVSQYFYLYSGRTYRLHFAYNCKTTGNPTMTVQVNGTDVSGSPLTVSACDAQGSFAVPFYEFDATFTVPTNGFFPIEIAENDAGTANVLLIDDFQLTVSNNPNPFVCDQDGGLDFGLVAKSVNVDTSFTIHNLGSATLNFGNNYGAVTNNAGWNVSGPDAAQFRFGYWDSNGVYQTYGANSTVFSVAGYDTQIRSTMRFNANTAQKVYNATLNLTWSNGTYAGIRSIPLKAEIAAYPYVKNGSFELPKASDWNGYPNSFSCTPYAYGDYLGDKKAIPYWMTQAADGFWYSKPEHGIGVEDRQNAARFNNYATPPNGRQYMYVQTVADQPALLNDGVTANGTVYDAYSPRTRTVRQYLGGFISGHTYKLSLWAGCRNSGASRAAITVALDNIQLTATNKVGSWVSNDNNYFQLGNNVKHCSTTLAYNSSFVKLEYTIPVTKEGPIPLDLISYAYRYAPNNATGTAWYNDSTVWYDQVEIFDMANTLPALEPSIVRYNNYPLSNTYQSGSNHYTNPNVYPATFWSGYNTQPGGLTYRMWNRGGGTLNLTKWAFEGVNGKHFGLPATAAIAPWGYYADLTATFKPKDTGYLTEKMVLTTNDTTGTYKFPLIGTSWGGPVIQNNSFELPPVYWGADVTASPAPNAWLWRSLGTNIVPPYWGFSANGGNAGVSTQMDADVINNAQTSFHVNNGLITQGNQALWMQAQMTATNVGNRSCRQIVFGWQSGTKYHFRVRANARAINDNQANFILRITNPDNSYAVIQDNVITASDTVNGSSALAAVDNVNEFTHPYTLLEGDYNCVNQQRLAVELYTPFNDDDSTVLIDSVEVQAVVNGVKKWNLLD